ncbi:MAG: phospholipid carrier-dependent glycosyltransferase, partial [Acidimicrobiales bacterium]
HGLGLASGVLVYALLVRRGSRRWVASLAAVPVLFDPLQLNLEQYVLPDTVAAFLMLAALVALVWRGARLTRRDAAVAGLLLLLATLMRLPDLVLIGPVILYLVLTVRPWRRLLARGGVLLLVFALPLVAYAGWFYGSWGQWGLTGYSGRFLYGRVATFTDCTGLALPAYERPLCPKAPLGHRASQDFYMWSPDSPQWTYRPPRGMTAEAVLRNFSMRVIEHQPLTYARVVADDFVYGFWPWRGPGPEHYPQWYHRFQLTYPDFHHTAAYNLATYGNTRGRAQPELAAFLHQYGLWYVPGSLLGLGLLVGLAAAAGLGRARRSGHRTACLLFVLGTLAVLVPPAALSEFDWRYQIPQLSLVPVAAVLGLYGLGRRRTPAAEEPARLAQTGRSLSQPMSAAMTPAGGRRTSSGIW